MEKYKNLKKNPKTTTNKPSKKKKKILGFSTLFQKIIKKTAHSMFFRS